MCLYNKCFKLLKLRLLTFQWSDLKGLSQQKLSVSMLNSPGHWSLWHRSFTPESFSKKENQIFVNFLRIVCVWKVPTGKERCVWKVPTGKEKCISNIMTGKEIVSQISWPEKKLSLKYHDRKRNWLSNIMTRKETGSQKLPLNVSRQVLYPSEIVSDT